MTVRTRFAPSPTGYLHIGGARTAMYSYLYAKAHAGEFVLRIEDTDLERSKREYEEAQIADLKWCGIDWSEGPDCPGEFGPYRQSERTEIYQKYAEQFITEGKAYYCFLSQDELEALSEKAKSEDKSPHAYHDKYRQMDPAEAKAKVAGGAENVIRFKNPRKPYSLKDQVRGKVSWGPDMVGDFVIIRSNGQPVYNFCCVVDDWKMAISHVFRGEEHLNNTLRQLMIYEALGATPPEFGHCSLLVGEDRQKLSKRHGATSVVQYIEQGYLPSAMMNYLCLLGWSHPEEKDIFDINQLGKIFDSARFTKSGAFYDIKKLQHFNGQHLRLLAPEELLNKANQQLSSNDNWNQQDDQWKKTCLELLLEKVNLLSELPEHLEVIFNQSFNLGEAENEALAWESTPQIKAYLSSEIQKLVGSGVKSASAEDFSGWMNHIKKELGIKGKPLFMGMRVVLTGQCHGPDLKVLIPLTPLEVLGKRLA
ncbi:MAG: glutamate--tRNA ligase [Halobacteriovoraceae bacterium]|nr:glutamate--tRNA ligase [Halobacteriovoraceae bacterium]